jgi:hypothetical protein
VEFEIATSEPAEFTVNLRIPAWAEGASISINGKRAPGAVITGQFASIHRRWKTGDRIELDLPLAKRLEPVDPQHPQIVALLSGPLVLFAIAQTAPTVTTRQLLTAKKMGPQDWQVETASGPLKMMPFTAISQERYSTYLTAG